MVRPTSIGLVYGSLIDGSQNIKELTWTHHHLYPNIIEVVLIFN
jgi:hypothetical protein